MIAHVDTLRPLVPVVKACRTLALARSSYYASKSPPVKRTEVARPPRAKPARALSTIERAEAVETLTSAEYVDRSPLQIYADLLDKGQYKCSERTFYRLLSEFVKVKERRNFKRHTHYSAPELVATKPRQVWTWDITRLKGHSKGVYYNLYVIIDMYSRYITGWLLAHREQDNLARDLIETSCKREGIEARQLTIHADRGSSMCSDTVASLYDTLNIRKSHSRPYCSNDNPYSESQFKTMKYSPEFPERFSGIEEARVFCTRFIDFYNNEMYHSGLSALTPAMVHNGEDKEVIKKRQRVLSEAFRLHPERFVKGRPIHKQVPDTVWINDPKKAEKARLKKLANGILNQ